MTEYTYTLVQPPGSLWECDVCGALVVRCSVHTDWHLKEAGLVMDLMTHYHVVSPTGQTGGPTHG